MKKGNKVVIWFVGSWLVYVGIIFVLWNIMSPGFTPEPNDLDIPWVVVDVVVTIVSVILISYVSVHILDKPSKNHSLEE